MPNINYKQKLLEFKIFVLEYFKTHQDEKLIYHNLNHTNSVVNANMKIANHYQLNDKYFFIVCTGAWFHETGYFEDIQNHGQKGATVKRKLMHKEIAMLYSIDQSENESISAYCKLS